MFKIEYLMQVIEDKLPSIKIRVNFIPDGYRIIVKNNDNYDYASFLEDRDKFLNILKQIKDLYVLKVCDGRNYVIKIMVILGAEYYDEDEELALITPSRAIILEDVDEYDVERIEDKLELNIYRI